MDLRGPFGITVEVNAQIFDGIEVRYSNTINHSVDGGRDGFERKGTRNALRRVELKTMVRGPTRDKIDSITEKGLVTGGFNRVANNKIISILKKDRNILKKEFTSKECEKRG